jgi:hypothetical protein
LRRNYLLQRFIEWKIRKEIEMRGRRGKRRRKLQDDHKVKRRYSYWKEKLWIELCGEVAFEEALDLS